MRRTLFVLLALPLASAAAQSPRAMQPNDWHRLTTLSQPAMSPDGKVVAFTVTTVNERENKRHQEVWVVPTAGGDPVRYTTPNTESSNPRFSPDGRYLFFSSQRAGGTGNTWAIRMDVPSGEATQLTDYPSGSWPRDGRFAVFTAPAQEDSANGPGAARGAAGADPYARMQPMARPPYDAITKPVDPARFDGRHITAHAITRPTTRASSRPAAGARAARGSSWSRRPRGAKREQVTDIVLAPERRGLARRPLDRVHRRRRPAPDSVVRQIADSIALLPYDARARRGPAQRCRHLRDPATGGTPRKVATLLGTETNMTWSPDSRRLAFVHRAARTSNAHLAVIDVQGGSPRNSPRDWRTSRRHRVAPERPDRHVGRHRRLAPASST
jgi:dipeptidyl aminopeptidase/acylaminoacyl peptidase